jgi:hypothetical protein
LAPRPRLKGNERDDEERKNSFRLSKKGKKKGQKQGAGERGRSGGHPIRPDPVNPTKGRGRRKPIRCQGGANPRRLPSMQNDVEVDVDMGADSG